VGHASSASGQSADHLYPGPQALSTALAIRAVSILAAATALARWPVARSRWRAGCGATSVRRSVNTRTKWAWIKWAPKWRCGSGQ
jgi:hypothetical protein